MLRKKIAVLIAAVMTAQMSVPAFAQEYSDVPRDHWAYSEIQKAGEIGFMSGMGDGTFGLGQNVTRAQFVSMLVRMLGGSASEGTGLSDVAPGDWYSSDVLTAPDMGVLDTTETYFRPNDNITREEMAVMIIKALGYGELAVEIANDGVHLSDGRENNDYISLA